MWRALPACPISRTPCGRLPRLERAKCFICPGLVSRDADGVADVMRGEEVQIFGALSIAAKPAARVLLPGTHSKHAAVNNGSVSGFVTHMTGEVFALLRDHSILGRLMAPRRVDRRLRAGLDRARHRTACSTISSACAREC